jgi:hypothetical protein
MLWVRKSVPSPAVQPRLIAVSLLSPAFDQSGMPGLLGGTQSDSEACWSQGLFTPIFTFESQPTSKSHAAWKKVAKYRSDIRMTVISLIVSVAPLWGRTTSALLSKVQLKRKLSSLLIGGQSVLPLKNLNH